MYLSHFGLRELPFTITPDTSFFFSNAASQDAFNNLLLAIHSGEGFVKVIGQVGTGKTLLCRKLLGSLDNDFVTAYIPNPYVEPMTLLLAVADELGIQYPEQVNQHQILKLLTNRLMEIQAERGPVILCLDEAQAMPVETLEALRLLSNLETERRKLLQVVLFGQPELDLHLSDPSIRQLKQRIAFSCTLSPLARDEVEYYLMHRLHVAGYGGPALFSRSAVRLLARASGNVPRLVNVLAHKSMMSAFGEGLHHVERRHVKLAIDDTESVHHVIARKRWRVLTYSAAVAASVLVAVGIVWYWRGGH